ncbi:MAG: hypothetical protein J0M02_19430 [Planctomycetes bacterium]|nr:hypothetical protein [Planctomycetota bacterium]
MDDGGSLLARQLRLLTRGLTAALLVVLVAAIAVALVVLLQMRTVESRSAPTLHAASALETALEQAGAGMLALAVVDQPAELETKRGRLAAALAACAASREELRRLGVDVGARMVEDLAGLAQRLERTTADHLASDARVLAATNAMGQEIDALLHGTGELSRAVLALREAAQTQLEQARAANSTANASIRRLMGLRDGLREVRAMVVQPALVEVKRRLRPLEDRMQAALGAVRAAADPGQGLDAELLAALPAIESGYIDAQDGLLALRARQLADPASAEAAAA